MGKKEVKTIIEVISVVIVGLVIAIMFVDTEMYKKTIAIEGIFFSICFITAFLMLIDRKSVYNRINLLLQVYYPMVVITLFWNLAFFSKYADKNNVMAYYGVISLDMLIAVMTFYVAKHVANNKKDIINGFKIYIKSNIEVILLCLVFFALSFSLFDVWLNEDGVIYYKQLTLIKNWNFSDFSVFKLAGHHSELYAIILMIGEFILPNKVIGVRLIIVLLAVITILMFNYIINNLFDAKRFEKFIFVSIFAFSPFMFSMIAEVNVDYPLLCFFVWLFYFYLKYKYILQLVAGLLLCFSKETGCVIYGMYVIGLAICVFIQNKNKILKTISDRRLLINSIPGFVWIVYFILSKFQHWGATANGTNGGVYDAVGKVYKNNSFNVWGGYILYRLKEIFIFNFQWVISLQILIGIVIFIFTLKKREKKTYIKMLPVIMGGIGCVLINVLYITYTHIRYVYPVLFFQMMLLALLVFEIIKNIKFRSVIILITFIVVLVSNFITDPITKKMFLTYNTGNGEIVCPRFFSVDSNENCIRNENDKNQYSLLNEGVAYNRQYIYRGRTIENLLKKIDYKETYLILVPNVFDNAELTYRNALLRSEAWISGKLMWNKKELYTNANTYYNSDIKYDSDWVRVNTRIVDEDSDCGIEDFTKYEHVFYLEIPFNDEYNHQTFLSKFEIVDKISEKNNIWQFNMYQIK